jgi:hydrogenase/urease accessory protein HupE
VRKYLLIFFMQMAMFVTGVESASAHEFDSLGVMVRHKENGVSLIAAPPLSIFETNAKGEPLDFDSNGDGEISFQELREFENDIAKRVEQLVIFQDEHGRIAKLQSFRLLEKGYENLLKISGTDDENTAKDAQQETKQREEGSDQPTYIQLSLKFQWVNEPQSIHLSYGLLMDEKKYVLVRNQNIGKSQVLVLKSSEPTMTIFPVTSDNASNTKSIWIIGIEHVLGGLDHILFILALALVSKKLKGLVAPLSAFTLAHSFSLVLVALGFEIGFPSRLIEVGIAMTIVIMALFELLGWKPKRLFLVTAVMGLIHGFGLGQALTDSMGGTEGWAIALVQITVGIELAQLAVALIFITALIHFPKLAKVSKKRLELCTSSIVACVGISWMVERLVS